MLLYNLTELLYTVCIHMAVNFKLILEFLFIITQFVSRTLDTLMYIRAFLEKGFVSVSECYIKSQI